MSTSLPIMIVGNQGGMNVGESLHQAAKNLGFPVIYADIGRAFQAPRLLMRFYWHVLGHRPRYLDNFSNEILRSIEGTRPQLLIATGLAPITATVLKRLNSLGIKTAIYLTDDPWNPHLRSQWFFEALPYYNFVFTPRTQSLQNLKDISCSEVHYLPFAYDPDFMYPPVLDKHSSTDIPDVIFVGGAETERVTLLGEFQNTNINLGLYGDNWNKYTHTKQFARGRATPEQLRVLTFNTKVNICLVRRANRDEHVMRSFEIPACKGCMIAEDTQEHRVIFGEEGKAVLYFGSSTELITKVNLLIANSSLRDTLAHNAHTLINTNHHTYQARLQSILDRTHVA